MTQSQRKNAADIPMRPPQWIAGLIAGFFIAYCATILLMEMVPPVSRDALNHHLAVPKLYIQYGGMVEIPEVPFSYYPMNLEMLYILPMLAGNDILPKTIHFMFGVLTSLCIFGYLRRRSSVRWGFLGMGLFLSLPVIIRLSTIAYVDLGLIFFSTASLLAFIKWLEDDGRWGQLILSAVFCGLGLGTKYNGIILCFVLTAFVPLFYLRSHHGQPRAAVRAAARGVVFLTIALLVFSPWMIRNYRWTGNPVYPLYDSLFSTIHHGGGENTAEGIMSALATPPRLDHFTYRHLAFDESWMQIAMIPLRIFYEGRDHSPRYFDGVLSPFLIIFPLGLLIPRNGRSPTVNRECRVFFWFSLLFVMAVFVTEDMRIRWVSPVLPPLVILSVMGLENIWDGIRRFPHASPVKRIAAVCFVTAILMPLAGSTAYVSRLFARIDPVPYVIGHTSRDQYISRHRPEYPVLRYANDHLPPQSNILGLFMGQRRYYLNRSISFNSSVMKKALEAGSTPRDVAAVLESAGFTHLLVFQPLFDRWTENNFPGKRYSLQWLLSGNGPHPLAANAGYVLAALSPD